VIRIGGNPTDRDSFGSVGLLEGRLMWRGPKDLKSADYSVDRLVTRERPLSTESRRSQSFGHNYIDFIATMARWPGRARAAAAGCRMAGARFGMGPVRGHCGRRRRILFPMSLLVALRILVRLDRSRRPAFPGPSWSGGAWKGANIIFDFFLSAPVQLSASIAGLILVGIYVWVRTATR